LFSYLLSPPQGSSIHAIVPARYAGCPRIRRACGPLLRSGTPLPPNLAIPALFASKCFGLLPNNSYFRWPPSSGFPLRTMVLLFTLFFTPHVPRQPGSDCSTVLSPLYLIPRARERDCTAPVSGNHRAFLSLPTPLLHGCPHFCFHSSLVDPLPCQELALLSRCPPNPLPLLVLFLPLRSKNHPRDEAQTFVPPTTPFSKFGKVGTFKMVFPVRVSPTFKCFVSRIFLCWSK